MEDDDQTAAEHEESGNQFDGSEQPASEEQESGDEEDDSGDEEEDEEEESEDEYDPVQQWHPRNPYRVRMDLPDLLSENLV